MACGKGNNNKPIEDFITHSPAPVDTAAKMSAIYTELSFKVTERRYRIFFTYMLHNNIIVFFPAFHLRAKCTNCVFLTPKIMVKGPGTQSQFNIFNDKLLCPFDRTIIVAISMTCINY